MPNILTTTTSFVSLTTVDKFAFIASGATLVGSVSTSIADSVITVLGSIYNSGGSYAVYVNSNGSSVVVGQGATLASGAAAIGFIGDNLSIVNHGTLMQTWNTGYNSLDLRGSNINLTNTGVISASGYSAAIFISNPASPPAGAMNYITNSGKITGPSSLDIRASVVLRNNGTIEASEYSTGFSGTSTTIINTGTFTASAHFFDGQSTITNSGTFSGNISFSTGSNLYDGRAGQHFGFIQGADGNDTLLGGSENNDLRGSIGNDVLNGGGGADRLSGGSGNDTIYFDIDDLRFGLVSGGADYDIVYNTSQDVALQVNLEAISSEQYFGSSAVDVVEAGNLGAFNATVFLGAGNDFFLGTELGDFADGMSDSDILDGLGGNDTMIGGEGADVVWGGEGADLLFGWYGADTLLGEEGNDTLRGEQDNDVLYGWLGADLLEGGDGNDRLEGEQDNDVLLGGDGSDVMLGGDGNDTAYGWLGNDSLYGWTGNDLLFGEAGNDLILGENGNDTIVGGRGFDTMNGGFGADNFYSAFSEIAIGEVDTITDFDVADRYWFENGAAVSFVNFGGGAGIHVNLGAGIFILDVLGANAAQLQAQTLFF